MYPTSPIFALFYYQSLLSTSTSRLLLPRCIWFGNHRSRHVPCLKVPAHFRKHLFGLRMELRRVVIVSNGAASLVVVGLLSDHKGSARYVTVSCDFNTRSPLILFLDFHSSIRTSHTSLTYPQTLIERVHCYISCRIGFFKFCLVYTHGRPLYFLVVVMVLK